MRIVVPEEGNNVKMLVAKRDGKPSEVRQVLAARKHRYLEKREAPSRLRPEIIVDADIFALTSPRAIDIFEN